MFDPEFIVLNFVLSDGDKTKYERNVIFNEKIKKIGIASSILPSERICTIINCCEEFFETGGNIPNNILKKFEKIRPSFNTKTVNNYSGQTDKGTSVERYTSNTTSKGGVKEQYTTEELSQKGDSGSISTMKKTEYIQKKER